jgi:hypothetical protein
VSIPLLRYVTNRDVNHGRVRRSGLLNSRQREVLRDKEFQQRILKLRDRCTEKRLDDIGSDPVDAATLEEAKLLLDFSPGPRLTYNQLTEKLDAMIRRF